MVQPPAPSSLSPRVAPSNETAGNHGRPDGRAKRPGAAWGERLLEDLDRFSHSSLPQRRERKVGANDALVYLLHF